MAAVLNKASVVQTTLTAAVAHSGTFTVAYPTGTTQDTFLSGLASTNNYIIVNSDRWDSTKFSLSYDASFITVTNSSNVSWAAGSTIVLNLDRVDGNDVVELVFPVNLAAVANGDVVTEYKPGIAGTIEYFSFVTSQPVTTAAKTAAFNLEIGTTNVTGGVLTVTSAAATPLGKVIEATAITGANTLAVDSKLSIEAASVTAFAEGQGTLRIRVRKSNSASDLV